MPVYGEITPSIREAAQRVCDLTGTPAPMADLIAFYVATEGLPWLEKKLRRTREYFEYEENVCCAEMAPAPSLGVEEHSFVCFFCNDKQTEWLLNIRPFARQGVMVRNAPISLSTKEEIAAWIQLKAIHRY